MNKVFRSIASAALAGAMLLSLAACGSAPVSGSAQNTTSAAANTATAAEAPVEYVYKSEYVSADNGESSVWNPVFDDTGFLTCMTVKVGEREPEEGEIIEYDGQLDIYENRLFHFNYDGSRTELPNYEPLKLPAQSPDAAEGETVTGYSSGMAATPDGNLIIIESVYESWYDGPESERNSDLQWNYYNYVEDYYIRVLDKTGKELSCAKIEKPEDQNYFSIYSFRVADSSTVIVLMDDRIFAIGTDGSIKNSVVLSGWAEDIFTARDGSIAVKVYDDGAKIYILDPKTLEFGKSYASHDGYSTKDGAGDYDCYYTNGATLYGYSLETESSELILNWLNCDINDDDLSSYTVLPDGRVFAVLNNWDTNTCKTELVTISRVPEDPSAKKETLVFACNGVNWNIKKSLIAFNRSHENVRIEIADYSIYNTDDDYNAGLSKLTTEMLAGQLPDIIDLTSMPYKQLASKGLLEDLYPYIDADSELSREDFFANILEAASVNGKLCTTVSNFSLRTVMGAKSVVGDGSSWTFEDFNNALASMPEDCTAFDVYTTQDTILSTLVSLNFSSLVDWSTGKCSFDSEEFVNILKFAALFPSDFDWDNYEWTEDDSTTARISSGKQMLLETYVSSLEDLEYNSMAFGGPESVAYVGYPGSDSDGHMVSIDMGYAMTSACKDKQLAWEFLRTFFTADYQRDLYGIPSNKLVYNEKLEDAMTPIYRTDSEGNKLLDENGEPIMEARWGYIDDTGAQHDFYYTPKEACDAITAIVENVHKVWNYDDSINEIVSELSKTFFAGQKTAEEAAKLIQSKAMIYVNEQR